MLIPQDKRVGARRVIQWVSDENVAAAFGRYLLDKTGRYGIGCRLVSQSSPASNRSQLRNIC